MDLDLNTIIYISFLMMIVNLILLSLILFNKKYFKVKEEKIKKIDSFIINEMISKKEFHSKMNGKLFLERFSELKQIFDFDKETEEKFVEIIKRNKIETHFLKRLSSIIKYRRIEAIVYLGIIATEEARKSLENILGKEDDYHIKIYIINSLVDIGSSESIYKIINTLPDAPSWYRKKAQELLYEYGVELYKYIDELKDSNNSYIKELIIGFASIFSTKELSKYLVKLIESEGEESIIKRKAAKTLSDGYFTELNSDKYIYNMDPYIRGIAIESLGNNYSNENILNLISMLEEEKIKKHVIIAITKILEEKPEKINILIYEFNKQENLTIKNSLAEVISVRMEYLILKLSGEDKLLISNAIKEIMLMGKNSEVISFLNRNKDLEIEKQVISILKKVLEKKPELKLEFSIYLNENVLNKCNLIKYNHELKEIDEKKNKKIVAFLYLLAIFLIIVFPGIYSIRHNDLLYVAPFNEQLEIYIAEFNYYLVYYFFVLNSSYIIILLFSYVGVFKQSKYWKIKKVNFLFKKGIMPDISIIAPAFNEEATIVESANSLLNLKYPDYELIIVNDGSKDNTLEKLIEYFNLEKVDIIVYEKLKTKPIRGIYKNKSIPKLTIVDKENGGKADSLNTGINISQKKYFCGIDADSLLESDTLLKLTSQLLDEEVECPAIGGNILPINGCKIHKGVLEDIRIPKNNLARLQNIEYIRAFMAGRAGWAQIESLLIISGAFGLFKKDRIIEIGGYLTSSGKFLKDTVGEDMELVVRLTKYLIDKKIRFKIKYAFNANCWTEVPESYKSLKKQRDRWHRGLIDILTYHRAIIGNPTYGKVGMVAFPYFFIFEMVGPLIEFQGYCMVLLSAIFGYLGAKIVMLLFISIILMGIMISLSSLYLAEKETNYYTIKEVMILILFSFIENFGPRQIISIWRVGGYISSLRKSKGWGVAERKGFSMER
ncbi:glycosyltransferase [Clostridium sp. SHJSY1]|uniref:glycosyltransferase n=1 Tax=Clostridium sp. SHJSY1 TaxID=2942483 RepID=UPI0028772287|nr:glycosyltransferase [Clostridium sp. SHJSY1]MDS0525676.1 glycosyltransferase [Clostridium sp. SHJSY1]